MKIEGEKIALEDGVEGETILFSPGENKIVSPSKSLRAAIFPPSPCGWRGPLKLNAGKKRMSVRHQTLLAGNEH